MGARASSTVFSAGFVGGVLEECGIRSSRSAAARSYLNWGRELKGPAVGAIGVFERGPVNGHVGFIVGRNADGQLVLLSGNSSNMVCLAPISYGRLLSSRWVPDAMLPSAQSFAGLPLLKITGPVSRNEA